jgi:FlaA1/EpsC-like NDP-sugar epimerase
MKKILAIYGAGEAGLTLAKVLLGVRDYKIAFFIDDNPMLIGGLACNLPIFNFDEAVKNFQKYKISEVIVAIPSLSVRDRVNVYKKLSNVLIPFTSAPGLDEILSGGFLLSSKKNELDYGELLGRKSIAPIQNLIKKNVDGQTILVTGAGGSIGEELCIKIASLNPNKLVLLDHSEHALFKVYNQLQLVNPKLQLVPVVGSISDEHLIHHLIEDEKLSVIFHAAAYKHVDLMEKNIAQAIKNNIFGTHSLLNLVMKYEKLKFVLISTDKAVKPNNIMGATKRICELMVLAAARKNEIYSENYRIVRFGNVLGSSGSVIPIFKEQISRGGPITIRDPEVTRYFMSISEAAELVLQAASLENKSHVFLLDMGEPVKIHDLAELMVHASGLSVKNESNSGGDIEFLITGLKAGEKLHEELHMGEEITKTLHPRILSVEEVYEDKNIFDFIEELKILMINPKNNHAYLRRYIMEYLCL